MTASPELGLDAEVMFKDNNCKDAPNHAGDFTTVAPTEGQQSLELDLSQC